MTLHFLSICNSAPSEVLARIALKAREQILEKNRKVIGDNLAALNAFFADYRHLFDWREPDGGCIAFIRYKGAEGVEEFTRRLVEESGVLFLPSSIYHSELGPVPGVRADIRERSALVGLHLLRILLGGTEPPL